MNGISEINWLLIGEPRRDGANITPPAHSANQKQFQSILWEWIDWIVLVADGHWAAQGNEWVSGEWAVSFHWRLSWMRWIGFGGPSQLLRRWKSGAVMAAAKPNKPIHQLQFNKAKERERSWFVEWKGLMEWNQLIDWMKATRQWNKSMEWRTKLLSWSAARQSKAIQFIFNGNWMNGGAALASLLFFFL